MNQHIPTILEIMGETEPEPAAPSRRKSQPDPEDPLDEVVKVKKTAPGETDQFRTCPGEVSALAF